MTLARWSGRIGHGTPQRAAERLVYAGEITPCGEARYVGSIDADRKTLIAAGMLLEGELSE